LLRFPIGRNTDRSGRSVKNSLQIDLQAFGSQQEHPSRVSPEKGKFLFIRALQKAGVKQIRQFVRLFLAPSSVREYTHSPARLRGQEERMMTLILPAAARVFPAIS
jgi:hypothetical protein